MLGEQSVRIDAGVVVAADSTLGKRVNQLAVPAEVQPPPELMAEIRSNRLLVVVVVTNQTTIMLHEAG